MQCFFLGLLLLTFTKFGWSELKDDHTDCVFWAEIGECEKNPGYMLQSCAKSCSGAGGTVAEPLNLAASFYHIQGEKDGDGKLINFESFRGKVVYVVNVASYCGYTAENYATFRKLTPYRQQGLEILIAPCNQFGFQEPGDSYAIADFTKKQSFEGIILSKADVNGDKTRPLFAYLKHATRRETIRWNFDGKFLVDKSGNVHVPGDDVEADIRAMLDRD